MRERRVRWRRDGVDVQGRGPRDPIWCGGRDRHVPNGYARRHPRHADRRDQRIAGRPRKGDAGNRCAIDVEGVAVKVKLRAAFWTSRPKPATP